MAGIARSDSGQRELPSVTGRRLRLTPERRIFVSAGPGRDALKVLPEFPVLYSRDGQVGTVAYTRCVRRTRRMLCRPGSEGDRTHPASHEAIVLPVPHEGTCQGVPPLRREPYAGLRRVSHEQCPERSRRRGRRVLARRLRARADRRGARAAGGVARDVRATPRGAARVPGGPRRRAGRSAGRPEALQTVLVGFRGVEDAAGTFSDIIAAWIQPAAVEMMDALALQAAEPPSAACRSDATSLTRWTGAGTPVWHSTRTAALTR